MKVTFFYGKPEPRTIEIDPPEDLEEYSSEWYDWMYDNAPIADGYPEDLTIE
jgi:hypothetical protein